MRLALGTVQFGLPYGISNQAGQVGLAEAADILGWARDHGIDTIDTAIAYGDSEAVLGSLGVGDFRVISKLPALPVEQPGVGDWVMDQVTASFRRLRVDRLGGLLLHRPDDLLGPCGEALIDALIRLKTDGCVEKIGISIYAPHRLSEFLAACPVELVQAPLNLIDRRLWASGWLQRLHENGVEIHARSVFLQGLLLMPPDRRPAQFARWQALWRRWDDWLYGFAGAGAAEACIGFVRSQRSVDRLVVGVETLDQLKALVRAANSRVPADFPDIACDDEDLINPALWSRT